MINHVERRLRPTYTTRQRPSMSWLVQFVSCLNKKLELGVRSKFANQFRFPHYLKRETGHEVRPGASDSVGLTNSYWRARMKRVVEKKKVWCQSRCHRLHEHQICFLTSRSGNGISRTTENQVHLMILLGKLEKMFLLRCRYRSWRFKGNST